MDENRIEGYGLALPVMLMNTMNDAFYTYIGIGPVIGVQDRHSFDDGSWGYRVMGYLGLGWNILPALRLTGEVVPIYQIDRFDDRSDFLLSPSIGIGYTF